MDHRFRGSFNRNNSGDIQSAPAQHPAQHPAQSHPPKQPKQKGFVPFIKKRWLLIVIALLVLVVIALAAGYFHTKQQLNDAKNPTAAGKTETQQIVNQIGDTVQLPTGETPTLATVQDITKLKSQQFFKNAQNGDKVLVYSKSGLAIIYRPSTKKVIIYSFISTNNQ